MDFERARIEDVETRVKSAVERAKEKQEELNAVVSFVDVDSQLTDLANKDPHAPLYGMPIVLKDNVNMKGVRTTASSRILDNYIPVYDAHISEKLKEAGAIVSLFPS